MRNLIVAALLICACSGTVIAQNPASPAIDDLKGYRKILDDVRRTSGDARAAKIDELLSIESHMRAFLEYAAATPQAQSSAQSEMRAKLAGLVERSRTDEQLGSAPNASGSSSAVAKASITSLLSFAIESGAVTQAINGTSASISGNADSLLKSLMGSEPFPYCPPGQDSCGTPILKDLAVSASFDVSNGGTQTVSTSGSNPSGVPPSLDLLTGNGRFSGVSVKYVFSNPRDVRSNAFQQQWTDFYNTNRAKFQEAGTNLLNAIAPALETLLKSDAYDALQTSHKEELVKTTSDDALLADFRQYLDSVVTLARSLTPDFDRQVHSAISGYMQYFAVTRPLIEQLNKEPVFSAEYDYEKPVDQPDLHRVRVLSTLNPFGAAGSLNINLAGTAYGSVTPMSGHWRDVQASLQLERRLGDLVTHPATFSLAAYYQYMISPGLIKIGNGTLVPGTNINLGQSAIVALAPKGSIWIAEAKFTLKLKGSGAEIPFAITRASRTDLIDAPVVRGHIGVTFDFDKLFAGK